MHFDLRHFLLADELNRMMADCLAGYFQMSGKGPFAVMLSGGRTPLRIYEELCRRGIKASGDLTILYSDERDVPPDSPESNYGNTLPLLNSLCIPPERVIRVHTELGWQDSASHYAHDLERFLAAGGRIPFGLLGLGADGHTASLFTADDVERGGVHYAVAIPKAEKPDRVSVTPALLRRIDRVVILATGADKREMIATLVQHPDDVVAGLALRDMTSVEIWQA